MPSTHIVHLKDYFERIARFPGRKNMLTIGDSWFQYPLRTYFDLQSGIAANSRLGRRANILDDSHPGRDAAEVKGRIAQWRRVAGELDRQQRPFAVFLISLGGNDVIGQDFRKHLGQGDVPDPSPWPWTAQVPEVARRWVKLGTLGKTFDEIAASYRRILEVRDTFARDATVVTHTYADVTPMDKPYTFGLPGMRVGPWIWKYLSPLGLTPAEQKTLVRWLLESFHALLLHIGANSADPDRFIVLDTRLELPGTASWDNEIHPLGPGFEHLIEGFWMPRLDSLV